MTSWYIYSIAALLLLGVQRFFYKVAAEKQCSTAWVTFSFMLTVTLLSGGLFLAGQRQEQQFLSLVTIAFLNSAAFLLATVAHIEALKYVSASITYTIIQLNVVVVVIFSMLYFKDRITPMQSAGLLLAVIAMMILARQMHHDAGAGERRRRGIWFVGLALIGGAAASVSSKFAAMHTDKLAFMALSYLMGMVGSLWINKTLPSGKPHDARLKEAVIIGILMGFFNFAGFYAFLVALETGPLSLIATIVGLHFVISILLSAIIYREKINPAGVVGLFLTIISIVLLRL
ncbi:MAG: DMT family transporter [Desulfobacterales bacterium]|jgi:drug/metabolite transporter (DMT)-like permease|nr:DMT family transporter [Desulfobacterales bacterium]